MGTERSLKKFFEPAIPKRQQHVQMDGTVRHADAAMNAANEESGDGDNDDDDFNVIDVQAKEVAARRNKSKYRCTKHILIVTTSTLWSSAVSV